MCREAGVFAQCVTFVCVALDWACYALAFMMVVGQMGRCEGLGYTA